MYFLLRALYGIEKVLFVKNYNGIGVRIVDLVTSYELRVTSYELRVAG